MFGFKASLNFFGKKTKKGHSQLSPDMNVSGAYRTSRDDSFGYNNSFEQPKRSTMSEQLLSDIRPTKSASDLSTVRNIPPHLRHSAVEVSRDPRGAPQEDHHQRNGAQPKLTKTQEREQRMLEKKRLADQKAREKQEAQEQAKQEKLRAERVQKETQPMRPKRSKESARAKESARVTESERVKRPDRKKPPAPKPQPTPIAATSQQYSSDTLESSISRSSGPPPYTDVPITRPETNGTQKQNDSSGNVTYSKPVDQGSWDMISQHRQQTIRPNTLIGGGGNKNKQLVMDLNYNFETTTEVKENSDASAILV